MNRYTLVLFHCLMSALRCCQGRQGTSFSLDLVRGDSVYFFTGLMRRSVSSKKRFSNRNAPFNTGVDNVAVRNSIYVLDVSIASPICGPSTVHRHSQLQRSTLSPDASTGLLPSRASATSANHIVRAAGVQTHAKGSPLIGVP